MHGDKVAERPDLLQGQLLDTKGGRDLRRDDGVVSYSLVRSKKETKTRANVTVPY